MSKRIALFCALIGVLAFVAAPAYAEVQNIKVSGDITAMGVYRNNYDMEDGRVMTGDDAIWVAEDEDSFFLSIVRLRVDADLTDNVSATIRLANVRAWDETSVESEDIVLDLAYITLKEMLYSPLTLIIGRQELNYGNGLIVGNGLYRDNSGTLDNDDLSTLHGYDAVRAILDYDPWTIELLVVKMEEGDNETSTPTIQKRDDDVDLYGVNLAHTFDRYDAEMEGYIFYKKNEQFGLVINVPDSPSNGRTFEIADTYVGGLRGSIVPIENLTLSAEVAGQWGEIIDPHAGPDNLPLTRDRQAMAANAAGEYNFADVRFNPVVGIEYLYTSGEEAGNDGDFEAWDPIYRGKKMGTIRDYLESLYTTYDPADTSGWTNQHTIKASGSLDLGELADGLSLDLAYLHYWFDEEPIAGMDDDIGDEVNLKLTYDYTEDVQFAIDGAVFLPGDYYGKTLHNILAMEGGGMATTGNAIAEETGGLRTANDTTVSIVGSCKVTF